MSAAEVAGVAGLVLAALLALLLVRTTRSVARCRGAVLELARTVDALRAEIARSDDEIERVDQLLEKADRISNRVDSASRLVAAPVIKAFAVGAGTRSAARRLRQRNGKD